MSLSGALGWFRTRPATATGPGATMSLTDHFRELRARLLISVVALVVVTIAAFFFYDQLLDLVMGPFEQAKKSLPEGVQTEIITSGVGAGLMIQLKLCALAGVILSSPIWLYQIWAFIVPAMHRNERRWTLIFIGCAGPLFAAGVAVGYYVMPKALQVLISFNPDNVQNLNDFNDFVGFMTRMLLVFGVAFQIPFFVVLLNLVGVVSGKALGRHRPWIILGTFVFAAVATPSTDPFSMLFLAVPMTLLFLVSEVIARLVDRRRGRRTAERDAWDDDAASPL